MSLNVLRVTVNHYNKHYGSSVYQQQHQPPLTLRHPEWRVLLGQHERGQYDVGTPTGPCAVASTPSAAEPPPITASSPSVDDSSSLSRTTMNLENTCNHNNNSKKTKKKNKLSLKEYLDRNNTALNNVLESVAEEEDGEESVQAWEVEDIDDRSVISFLRTLPQLDHHTTTSTNNLRFRSMAVDDEDEEELLGICVVVAELENDPEEEDGGNDGSNDDDDDHHDFDQGMVAGVLNYFWRPFFQQPQPPQLQTW